MIDPVPGSFQVGHDEGALAAHAFRVDVHLLERRTDMGGEVDLVDDKKVRAGNAGPPLGGDFVACRDINDIDGEISQFRRKVARVSPPDSISTRSRSGNFIRMSATAARFIEASSRIAV
jgi:hypothetical protein